ncbi:MAG TPA: UDP-N-acetylmuramate--L-alanine ligase [Prolixibacteraceae bacterium]|nr:UDP-N-acetylmuramate--L-alanine ligase [Prolixibacteraceae bacterium]
MIDFNTIENLYFLGIGGIGMSALARYARIMGKNVAGYDRVETPLTRQLESEGITIHYKEDINQLPALFTCNNTLVVRTPAVPDSHLELRHLAENGYTLVKRSELLGFLTRERKCIAVAGTHGKTSVSTMTAFLLRESGMSPGAFLGGISNNFASNLLIPGSADAWTVTEADEFDRSFLHLSPSLAVITSADPDHLDVYGDHASVLDAFNCFAGRVRDGGILLMKSEVQGVFPPSGRVLYRYSIKSEADFYAGNIRIESERYRFDFHAPGLIIRDVVMEYPGRLNVENMVAALSVALLAGADPVNLKRAVPLYRGVERRFDIRYRDDRRVYIDDYAHHPEELKATILAVKELFPRKKVLGIFQPHLFTRTRDFADGFAASLDLLDETFLLDIYPAREQPIEGVTSELILSKMKSPLKRRVSFQSVTNELLRTPFDVLLTLGAGNIDGLVEPICILLNQQTTKR